MAFFDSVPVSSEWQTDASTGRRVRRWTDLGGNDQLLYFTTPSHSEDGRWLALISDRGGHYNVWVLDRAAGEMHRVSDNRHGFARSYVYFDGDPNGLGLSRSSPSFDTRQERLFFVQDHKLIRVDLKQRFRETIAELPPNEVTAFTHVSRCGEFVCVPTIHRRPFDVTASANSLYGRNQVGRAADAMGIGSTVRVYQTRSGEVVTSWEEPGWVTHVQFRPTSPRQILYNHEWAPFSATRRMWLWNGAQSARLRPASAWVDPRGGAVHEVWCEDGQSLIYHGSYAVDPIHPAACHVKWGITQGMPYIGRCWPDGDFRLEIPLKDSANIYGHFMPDAEGNRLVSDGYFSPEGGTPGTHQGRRPRGQWITLFHVDWEKRSATAEPLCRHGSSWTSQDAHPHPIFGPDSQSVWFTSDREGRRAIYEVLIEAKA